MVSLVVVGLAVSWEPVLVWDTMKDSWDVMQGLVGSSDLACQMA